MNCNPSTTTTVTTATARTLTSYDRENKDRLHASVSAMKELNLRLIEVIRAKRGDEFEKARLQECMRGTADTKQLYEIELEKAKQANHNLTNENARIHAELHNYKDSNEQATVKLNKRNSELEELVELYRVKANEFAILENK
jgi:hypothetical protein